MRILDILVTVVTILPTVFSVRILLPETLCKTGTQRCHDNNVEECDPLGNYVPIQACSDTEFCTIDAHDPNTPGQCTEQDCVVEPCLRSSHRAIARAPFINDMPPTRSPSKNLESRSYISKGTPSVFEHCITAGEWRCSGKQVEMCSTENAWVKIESCSDTEECRVEYNDARCQLIVASTLLILRSPTGIPEWCRTGESRCLGNVLQLCEQNSWKPTMCPNPSKCVKRDDVAQCWVELPFPSVVPELCVPGDRKCDSDAYALQLCGKDGVYHTEKKCTTPGDCKTDRPGQAHCGTGSIDPPKFERQTNSTQCTHGDYACDTHRRFMFVCINGAWQEPIQCHRAGACQPVGPTPEYPKGNMDCIGFPKYLYPDNRVCETVSSCEFMRYMYCSAVSALFIYFLTVSFLQWQTEGKFAL
jgi:hypothetical protein